MSGAWFMVMTSASRPATAHGLFAGAAMRYLQGDGFAGLNFPVLLKGRIVIRTKIPCDIIATFSRVASANWDAKPGRWSDPRVASRWGETGGRESGLLGGLAWVWSGVPRTGPAVSPKGKNDQDASVPADPDAVDSQGRHGTRLGCAAAQTAMADYPSFRCSAPHRG